MIDDLEIDTFYHKNLIFENFEKQSKMTLQRQNLVGRHQDLNP
jgi:hypothetical protein